MMTGDGPMLIIAYASQDVYLSGDPRVGNAGVKDQHLSRAKLEREHEQYVCWGQPLQRMARDMEAVEPTGTVCRRHCKDFPLDCHFAAVSD